MIPLAVPNIGEAEGVNLAECVKSTMVSSVGPFVNSFEQAVGQASGSSHDAVATSAGTPGLHVALVAAGVRRDDLVFAPSFTFIATANAISHAGATPWLLDSTPSSWTMDPSALETALATKCARDPNGVLRRNACGRRVSAIMPVYSMGHPPEMEMIAQIARAYGLTVISDAAAAIGAKIHETPIVEHGAALTVFSFNGNKTLTCGGGGAVVGKDEELLSHVRHLTTTARRGPGYDHDEVGFNYRMTNLQAAVGCAQIARLEEFLAAKQTISARYASAFSSIDWIEAFPEEPWAVSAHWLSGVFAPSLSPVQMETVRDQLREAGVDARPFWRPIHQQAPYREAPKESMPVTDAIWERVLPLPCSTHLSVEEQDFVIEKSLDIFRAI